MDTKTRIFFVEHRVLLIKTALVVVLVADQLTGVGSLYSISIFKNFSLITRFLFLIFSLFLLGLPKSFFSKAWLPLQIVGFITMIPLIFQVAFQGVDIEVLKNYSKLLYPYVLLATFWTVSRDNKIKILSFIFEIYLLSLLATYFMGLGKATYPSGLGWKGLFYAGNELSALLLITFPFFLANQIQVYRLYALKMRHALHGRYLLVSSLFFRIKTSIKLLSASLLTFLPATKSLILGIPIIVSIILKNILSRKLFSFFFGVTILISAYPVYTFLYKRLLRTMARTETLTMAIYEKRYFQLMKYFKHLFDHPEHAIWGLGTDAKKIGGASTELDIFDFAIHFGMLSSLFFFVGLIGIYYLYYSEIRLRMSLQNLVFLLGGIFYMGLSFFVGHCVFSGVVAIPYSIIISEIFFKIRIKKFFFTPEKSFN